MIFLLDHVYDETKSTLELFDEMAKPIVTSALNGINGTIFAYGQTSSGKVIELFTISWLDFFMCVFLDLYDDGQ